jgi:hypothetical protein
MRRLPLISYPDGQPGVPEAVEVALERRGDKLWLRFEIQGEPDGVVWPAKAEPARTDELWKHTCFEAFVLGEAGYGEFNLSPSGQWAVYRFDAYREGMRPAPEEAVVLGLEAWSDGAALEALIDLPPGARSLGLSAVIESPDGARTYWALGHPSDRPDFHHPDSFRLDLP